MDQPFRQAYNAAFSPDLYRRYLERLEGRFGCKIPFRVAETPFFMPRELRGRLERSAREIVEAISNPALIASMQRAVPAHLNVPRQDDLSSCIQVDFAVTRDADGSLTGRLVELQGFPSLYGLIAIQTEVMNEVLAEIPGLDRRWTTYFGGLDRATYVARMRRAIVADNDPAEVVLLDLDPPSQKTYPDFLATKMLLGVDAVCPTTLEKDGRQLFRRVDGRRVPVKRIFNRIVFDELEAKKTVLPFSYTDDLDVTWCPHPNWYWIWSKYTIPHLDHPAVPKATFLSDLREIPDDLTRYVLKPLFSFAGSGVKVDVTKADIDAIPDSQRSGWILQRKIEYAPALITPDGAGVKAEVRMMFLRAPGDPRPELVMNLVRLSRGQMLGVDQNKNLDWVGGTVGIWPEEG
jgi:hypothetical protein